MCIRAHILVFHPQIKCVYTQNCNEYFQGGMTLHTCADILPSDYMRTMNMAYAKLMGRWEGGKLCIRAQLFHPRTPSDYMLVYEYMLKTIRELEKFAYVRIIIFQNQIFCIFR